MQASTTKATWVEPVVYAGIEYIASAFQAGYDGSGLSWRAGLAGPGRRSTESMTAAARRNHFPCRWLSRRPGRSTA
jgi:hypothetical protein